MAAADSAGRGSGAAASSCPVAGVDLRPFFEAASVVVVGASSDPTKNSGKPLYHLSRHGYQGQVCAVNPRHEQIFGFPSYQSVEAIPGSPELALIMLPAAGAADAIRACGARGVRAAVVFGNGFADVGRADLQEELAEAARQAGMRLLGPNCLGAVNTANGLTASFSSYLLRRAFRPGRVALATQSGSIGNAILMDFQDLGVGLSKWVATGNEADVDLLDVVEYMVEDPASHVIAVFAEAFRRGWRWPGIATRAYELGKPIIVLKAGIGVRSMQAVISHSGKIAGVHKVWEDLAALEHLAVVDSVEELCDAAQALASARVHPANSRSWAQADQAFWLWTSASDVVCRSRSSARLRGRRCASSCRRRLRWRTRLIRRRPPTRPGGRHARPSSGIRPSASSPL